MNKDIRKININSVLFFDVETATVVPELIKDTPLYNLYGHKTRDRDTNKWLTEAKLKKHFREKGALKAPYNKIICLTIGIVALADENHETDTIHIKCIHGEEADIIEQFYGILNTKVDAKGNGYTLGGFNITGFDMPLIEKKALKHGIHTLHYYYSHVDRKPWEVGDADMMKIYRGTGYENESLNELCSELDIPSPKDGISGEEVSEAYWAGRLNEICRYCNRDVVSSINVFRKMQDKEVIEVVIDKTVYEEEAEEDK